MNFSFWLRDQKELKCRCLHEAYGILRIGGLHQNHESGESHCNHQQ